MPNNCKSLEKMKETQICHHHFDCDWITNQGGGKQPTQPPSIFSGIPNSCCKQSSPTPRWTKTVTVKTQSTRQKYNQNLRDKSKILKLLQNRLPRGTNNTVYQEEESYFLLTKHMGQNIVHFAHFKKVKLHLKKMELRYLRNCFPSKRTVYLLN